MKNTQLDNESKESFTGCLATFGTAFSYFILLIIASFFYFLIAIIAQYAMISPLDDAGNFLLAAIWALKFLVTALIPLLLAGIINAILVAAISYTIGRSREAQWLQRILCASIIGVSTWLALSAAVNTFNNQITFNDLQSFLFPFWPIPLLAILMAIAALLYTGTYL